MTQVATILVVDDASEMLAILAQILSDEGYLVRRAESGEAALASAFADPPDLVILDLRMPGLDGVEVCRRLKQHDATRHVPVILASGVASSDEWAAALAAGATEYLVKPFRAEEVLLRVATQLQLRAAAVTIRTQAREMARAQRALDGARDMARDNDAALAERDAFYLEQFMRTPIPMLVVDPQSLRLLDANPAAVSLYGYPRSQLLAMSVTELNGRSVDETMTRMRQIVDRGLKRFEVKHRLASGAWRSLVLHSTPIVYRGKPATQTFIEDVSAHRASEESRRQSEELYRQLVEMLPEGVLVHADGKFVYANSSCARMLGVPAAVTLIGRDIMDFVHPDSHAQVMARRRDAARGATVPLIEQKYVRADGSTLWAESTAVQLTVDGTPSVLVLLRDVSERKAAERAIDEGAARYRLLTENMKDVVWVLDAETLTFDYVSPSVQRLRGYTADEVRAVPMTHALTEEAANAVRLLLHQRRQAFLTGDPDASAYHTTLLEQPCKDGSSVWTEVVTNLFLDPDTQRVKVLGVTRDISERRRAEEEQARMAEQLHQAQKMESVGRLAGGIAHDFNNMLSVILGNVELALNEVPPGSTLVADLHEVQHAARHSAEITRQLLSYARRQTVAPTVLSINSAVSKALSLLRPLLGEEIEVCWQPDADAWPVAIDPTQLDQIVANLCLNARDAIAGIGTLTLSTTNATVDPAFASEHPGAVIGDYTCLRVVDTGRGMSAAVMAQIFEPFFTTKAVGLGTGLGLATVYGAVRQANGFVTVESAEGAGSTFSVYLPRHELGAVARVSERSVTVERGHETILVVEDEPAILRLATRALKTHGYQVLGAGDAHAAIRAAAAHEGEIHLLLTDVVMPAMNGRQLVDAIRTQRPSLRHLYMSGYVGAVLSEHGVSAEAPLVAKPFTVAALLSRVREVLDLESAPLA